MNKPLPDSPTPTTAESLRPPCPYEPAWMTNARRLEAEHREYAARQMFAKWMDRTDPQGISSDEDRIDRMDQCRRLQASRPNLYRKRPQMDDLREGMTDSERAAFDRGVRDGLGLAAEAAGRFRSPIPEVAAVIAKMNKAIWDIIDVIESRYGKDPALGRIMWELHYGKGKDSLVR